MKKLHSLSTRRLAIWPTLPPDVHFRSKSGWRPFPLDQDNCRIYSRARHAIWNACHALGLGKNDVILVPAYHHGSEIEALLEAGLQIRYYEVNEALEPEREELQALLGSTVRALYLIHYLGFPQDAMYWRQWCDERNLLLIEDAAQAFLSMRDGTAAGSFGHMGVFCFYKTYGIPDGGAVISAPPPVPPKAVPQTGVWRMLKRHINWVAARRGEVGVIHLLIKPVFAWWKRINEKPHAEFDLGDPATPPSAMTSRLLPKLLDERTAERRRRNYDFLLKHLHDLVPAAFLSLPEGACPFAFPIEVSNPKLFLDSLHRRGVLGLLFWLNPHPSLPVDDFPRSRALRERVLALPVHQELRMADLIMIVRAVQQCLADRKETVATVG